MYNKATFNKIFLPFQ